MLQMWEMKAISVCKEFMANTFDIIKKLFTARIPEIIQAGFIDKFALFAVTQDNNIGLFIEHHFQKFLSTT